MKKQVTCLLVLLLVVLTISDETTVDNNDNTSSPDKQPEDLTNVQLEPTKPSTKPQKPKTPQINTSIDYKLQVMDLTSQTQINHFKNRTEYLRKAKLRPCYKDFSCLTELSLQVSGLGKILQISNCTIKISDIKTDKILKLYVGTCSRIQATSPQLIIGQYIAWKGDMVNSDEFNLHYATCWSL